ncbi:MAG: response regulator [Bacteroidia bacterium]|nr:response regulator [Bacteroidia bacterium]
MADLQEKNVYIYLVDDDDFYLKVFENKFKTSTGCITHTFNTGEDLVDFIGRKPLSKKLVHIVVMDYYLQSIENQDAKNGIEILKIVKDIDPEVEVILYSGIEDDSIVSKGIQLGAVTFVKKNENTFMRIHNSIKGIISKHNLEKKHTTSKLTKRILILLIVACIVALGVIYIFNPDMF